MAMAAALRLMSWFVVPIAVPAWLFESLYRKASKRFWEFDVWSGTIYILLLVGLAFLLLFSSSFTVRLIGVYIFTALEVLGIFLCAAVPFGNIGGYESIIRRLARRSSKPDEQTKPIGASAIWIALTSYLYSAFYFAVVSYFMYDLNSALFVGVQGSSDLEVLFDFIYFSYVSMATLGFTTIYPAQVPSKLTFMAQVTIGLFFVLFIFSLIANQLMARRSGE